MTASQGRSECAETFGDQAEGIFQLTICKAGDYWNGDDCVLGPPPENN
jgi:hypothetical protein